MNIDTYYFDDIKLLSKLLLTKITNHYEHAELLYDSLYFTLNLDYINFIKQLDLDIIFVKVRKQYFDNYDYLLNSMDGTKYAQNVINIFLNDEYYITVFKKIDPYSL